MEQVINDGNWLLGLDSISYQLPQGEYQWAQNVTNRGGLVGTRQGFAQITALAGESQIPRGICLFSPLQSGSHPTLVVAIGSYVHAIPWPYTTPLSNATRLNNIFFPTTTRAVNFEIAVQAQKNIDGSITSITPRFVLMMQDGVTAPAYYYYNWDTSTFSSGHTIPTNDNTANPPWNTPIGQYMKWVGDRLWVSSGNKLHAGDLLNPLQFEEEKVEASGGFFFLPADVTGMGVTHDFKSLLVMSAQTTSAFQVGIEDRTLWPNTQDFQRVLFPSIGCASNRTIVNQYGMTWWMSHDGVVALDSSLQTYQTSRMQVRDHNMSRSKEGISWVNGGGAAGTFGNWLFFSVPSNSPYNNHTWVLDQSVQSNLNALSPPAWVANWTGIRPEQWVTGTVNGEQRCFCLSNDLVTSGHQATVWEAFIGQRMDVPRSINGPDYIRSPKDIACAMETKFYALAPNQYMQFLYAELDLAEIVGTVNLQVYYCGRRTSYKKILDKQITATVTPTTEEVFDPDDLIDVFVPQYRTVRSVQDSHDSTDSNTGIQTPYLRMIDREFSLLITWTGQMSVADARICVAPRTDYTVGRCEEDELTARSITAEGTGSISTDLVPPNAYISDLTSKYLAPLRARWVEFPAYDSAVPNGVFFVDIPTYDPPAGGYPLDQYSPYKLVTLSTELVGTTIVYTADGSVPSLTPLNGFVYTAPLQITPIYLPLTLNVVAFRDGMLPSAMASGVYSQAACSTPIYTPSEGQYPETDYPKSISIRSTSGATIRYTTNNTPVTSTSPTYSVPVSVNAGQWLRARAFKTNYLDSVEKVGQYPAETTCAEPTFNPDGGSYNVSDYPKSVAITSTTTGATIQYTINDETISNGLIISNGDQVAVNINDTLRARSQKSGLADSSVKQATYTTVMQNCNEPTLEPDGGEFVNNIVVVTFRCTTPNATICYTIDSLIPPDPTRNQSLNRVRDGDQISVSLGHKFIKALAFTDDTLDSTIHLSEYQIFHP